jgi:ABC-type antimicrobial peptide transport system ATPase subunit
LPSVKRKKSKKKPRRQVRRDNIPAITDEPEVTLPKNIKLGDLEIVQPRIMQVLASITVGDLVYSGIIMKAFGWNKRRSLEYLDKLEQLKYLTSRKELVRSPKGFVTTARVFTRVK